MLAMLMMLITMLRPLRLRAMPCRLLLYAASFATLDALRAICLMPCATRYACYITLLTLRYKSALAKRDAA